MYFFAWSVLSLNEYAPNLSYCLGDLPSKQSEH